MNKPVVGARWGSGLAGFTAVSVRLNPSPSAVAAPTHLDWCRGECYPNARTNGSVAPHVPTSPHDDRARGQANATQMNVQFLDYHGNWVYENWIRKKA